MKKGFDEEAAEVMLSSVQESTLNQYETPIRLWWEFCKKSNTSPYDLDAIKVTKFFTLSFKEKFKEKSFSTLNTYRAALSLLNLNDSSDNNGLSRFFKGLSAQKPQTPKYDAIWDPAPVVNYLSSQYPNENLSLEELTNKLVTLLALDTAQRVQTLSKISIENIEFLENSVQIKIPERIKTSRRNKNQPFFNIPNFQDQKSLCVATMLKAYLLKTEQVRSNHKKLFITHKKPHHEASSQTISRWVRNTLKKSGINTSVFTAHSTRHASTSAAARKGINIETIRKTAGWTENSSVFARFYNRPLVITEDFTSDVMKN